MVYPTFRADPLAVLERQFLFAAHDMATSVAGLRRIPRVDGNEVLAVQCCLIIQHTEEHPPAIVLDAHSQGMVLQQVPAPQFFCCDQIVVLDQCRGSAVQEISAALHDLCREPGDEQALFLDVLCLTERAMLFLGTDNPTAQLALCVGQPSFLPAVITRIGHNLAIRVGIEVLDVQVDANLCLCFRAGFHEWLIGAELE